MTKEIKLPPKKAKEIKNKNLDKTGSKALAKALDAVGKKGKKK